MGDDVQPADIKEADVKSQYVKLRGLPFSINEKEIRDFFGELNINRVKILSGYNGKATGEAIVEMGSKEDAGKAMFLDRKEIKKRYIEVFSTAQSEGEGAFKSGGANGENDGYIVRLRGVPWSCSETDVKSFFEGLETSEVVIGTVGGPGTKATGEAFAKFASIEESQSAMEYNNKHMGSRYIEVFQSNHIEFNRAKGLPVPEASHRAGIRPLMAGVTDSYYPPPAPAHHYDYGGGGAAGYGDPYGGYDAYGSYDPYATGAYGGYEEQSMRLYMRGLPFDADARAIEAFFSPIRVASVKLGITDTNRASGDAIAEFDDYDSMVGAMNRNNHRMGRRYVELFYTRDAPGNMKKLLWRDASGPNVGTAPALDPVINGWSTTNNANSQQRQQIGPVMPADRRQYAPPPQSGRGRGGPPPRGGPGHNPGARAARDAWAAYGYDTNASQWPAHDPYADRQREAHAQHDPSASSWGSYPQY